MFSQMFNGSLQIGWFSSWMSLGWDWNSELVLAVGSRRGWQFDLLTIPSDCIIFNLLPIDGNVSVWVLGNMWSYPSSVTAGDWLTVMLSLATSVAKYRKLTDYLKDIWLFFKNISILSSLKNVAVKFYFGLAMHKLCTAMNWGLIQGVTMPNDSWERRQLTHLT